MQFLIEEGAVVTAQDNEAIIDAFRTEHLDIVRFLAEKGYVTANDNLSAICASEREIWMPRSGSLRTGTT